MSHRTGFVSFDRRPYEESFEWGGQLDMDYVELLMDGNAHRTVLDGDAESVRASLAANDLDLLVHLPFPMVIASPHEHQRAGAVREMKECIRTAAELGAEKGVMHPDSYGWVRVWDDAETDPILFDAVAELHSFAAEHGIEICVENLFEGYLDIYDMDRLFDATAVSATLDTGHAAIVGMDEPEMAEFLTRWSDRVSHIHLNDTRHLDVSYRHKDEHLPLGYGTQDFETILGPVTAGNWEGTLSIELDSPNFEYLRASARHLETCLTESESGVAAGGSGSAPDTV